MHATEAYGRVEVHISLGTRWTWLVSFTPRLLPPPVTRSVAEHFKLFPWWTLMKIALPNTTVQSYFTITCCFPFPIPYCCACSISRNGQLGSFLDLNKDRDESPDANLSQQSSTLSHSNGITLSTFQNRQCIIFEIQPQLPSSKNALFLELHFVQNVYNVYIKTHTDTKTCDARVDWIYLTITIRGDVISCSLVGRFQLSEEPATHTLMAVKWICHIQGVVDWTKQLSFVFHKNWRISWRAARLPVSQEGRSFMKWVDCFCNLHAWLHNLRPTTSKSENADKIYTFHEGSLAEPKSFKFCCVWINMFHSTSQIQCSYINKNSWDVNFCILT